MRFYQKTYEFNELLPIYAVKFMKVGIILHIVATFSILSNRKLLPIKQLSSTHFEYSLTIPEQDKQFLMFSLHQDIYFIYSFVLLVGYIFC